MLAIIGGRPERFAPHVELYKRALEQFGQPQLPVGLHSLGFVAETDEQAIATQWPFYKEQFDWAAQERGWRPPTYDQFLAEVDHGSMYVGSPDTVARRIATVVRTLRLSRFDLLYALGRVPHEQRMATIALYGGEVIPRVRALLAEPPNAHRPPAPGLTMARGHRPRTPSATGATICGSASSARASSARRWPARRSRRATTWRCRARARRRTSR